MPLCDLPDITIRRTSDLVAYVERNCRLDGLLFRGQREDWELLPKLARLQPRDMSRRDLETKMLSDFIRTAPPYIELEPKSKTEWLAVAQHFGMATRLLDWTLNPLAALWFAVQSKAGEANGVLWVLQSDNLNTAGAEDLNSDEVLLVRPRHIVGRIASQLGMFVLLPFEQDQITCFERMPKYATSLKKLVIDRAEFSEIRWVLDRCGLNAATIYPDLEGLSRHLQWANTFEVDEGPYEEPGERAM